MTEYQAKLLQAMQRETLVLLTTAYTASQNTVRFSTSPSARDAAATKLRAACLALIDRKEWPMIVQGGVR